MNNDNLGQTIHDVFEQEKKNIASKGVPTDLQKRMDEIMKAQSIADKYNKHIYGHNVMETSTINANDRGEAAAKSIEIAQTAKRDAVVISQPGVVLINAQSRAMENTLKQYARQRQDTNLNNGKTVACIVPSNTQTPESLVESIMRDYSRNAAIEYAKECGATKITQTQGMIVAQGRMNYTAAQDATRVLNAEVQAAAAVYKQDNSIYITITADDKGLQAIKKLDGPQISSRGPSDSPTFKFDSKEAAQSFLDQANAAIAASKAQIQPTIKQANGITFINTSSMSFIEGQRLFEKLGAHHDNSIGIHSLNGSKDKVAVTLPQNELTSKLLEKYSNNTIGSSSPNLVTLRFDSREAINEFLKDASALAQDLNRAENDGLDTNGSMDEETIGD